MPTKIIPQAALLDGQGSSEAAAEEDHGLVVEEMTRRRLMILDHRDILILSPGVHLQALEKGGDLGFGQVWLRVLLGAIL